MKLIPAQLEAHLAQTCLPVYFITGDELVLKNEGMQLLRKAAKQRGYTERSRLSAAAGYDWDELHAVLQSTSLMAEKKLIELDFRDQLPPKQACVILEAYANNPSPDTLLLIELSKLDDKINRAAWFKALDRIGATLAYWPIAREQLPAWLQQRARKYKLTLQADAAKLLADMVEGNLVAATQMLEKIYLLKPDPVITVETLEPMVADQSRFTVFDLMEVVLNGQSEKALHVLHTLREDDIEPVLVLWAITRELRELAGIAKEVKSGVSLDTAFQKRRIFTKRQAGIRKFLQKNQPDDCLRHLVAAEHIDAILKGAAPGNPWDALGLFCLRLL